MVKRRHLGRGLDALLGEKVSKANLVKLVAVDLLKQSPFQPRKSFDEPALTKLADSIKKQGMMQPIVARRGKGNTFEIIAGERRWRAAQLAKLQEVPVIIKAATDETVMCMSLIENIQRENLNPIEEAQGLHRLLVEFNMTHENVAEVIGRSRSAVTNLLRLLELHPEVKALVQSNALSMGQARTLLPLPKAAQCKLADKIIAQSLSVRKIEQLVKNLLATKKTDNKKPAIDPNIRHLQNDLAEKIAAKVEISHAKSGKGTLKIYYGSMDQLDGILQHIK